MNSAMKALAAERAARNGSALPRQTPKPSPQGMVHGAVVYARHNAPEKDEGDAMADEEGG